jgi:UDP-2,3-diacylglucosamine pyrophosphatase LpxH
MDQKRVTLIVSDLHMGDGRAGDDFVDGNGQFVTFVGAQAETAEGRAGQVELIINGDFLEFAQVYPEAYTMNSPEYWCSEAESIRKLDILLSGHPKVFAALADFQRRGNRVTLFAGNHDVELYWPEVQSRICGKVGNVNIEFGEVWYHRYGGRLRISHGHLFPSIDPANFFKHWKDPCLKQPSDSLPQRLEMCPGTLFITRFVNHLEDKYPFADNLHPEIALAGILWREDKWGLMTVAWMLGRFAVRHPMTMLSSEATEPDIGAQLAKAIKSDAFLRKQIATLYQDVLREEDMTADKVAGRLGSEEAVADFIEQLIRTGRPWEEWVEVLDMAKPGVLGVGEPGGGTLTIRKAESLNVREECLKVAQAGWNEGAQIVVFGHTHLPQEVKDGQRRYYNPGSWTRYVEADPARTLTLEDLKDESRFPYELNYVRVEDTGRDTLLSSMICVERMAGR